MKLNILAVASLCLVQTYAGRLIRADPTQIIESLMTSAKDNLKILNDNVKLIRQYGRLFNTYPLGGAFLNNGAALFLDLFTMLDMLGVIGPITIDPLTQQPKAAEGENFLAPGYGCGRRVPTPCAACPLQPANTCNQPFCRPDCAFSILEAVRCTLQSIEAIVKNLSRGDLVIVTRRDEVEGLIVSTLQTYMVIGAFLDPCIDSRGPWVASKDKLWPGFSTNPFSPDAFTGTVIDGLGGWSSRYAGLVQQANEAARQQNPALFAYFENPEEPEQEQTVQQA